VGFKSAADPEMVIRCPERSTSQRVSPSTIGTAHDGGIRSVPFHGEAGEPSCDSLSGPVGVCRPSIAAAYSQSHATLSPVWGSNVRKPLKRRKDTDPAIERVYARVRFSIMLVCAVLIAGALFTHGLHALIGSLLAALGSATAAPPR
jgi:hypothetical protein